MCLQLFNEEFPSLCSNKLHTYIIFQKVVNLFQPLLVNDWAFWGIMILSPVTNSSVYLWNLSNRCFWSLLAFLLNLDSWQCVTLHPGRQASGTSRPCRCFLMCCWWRAWSGRSGGLWSASFHLEPPPAALHFQSTLVTFLLKQQKKPQKNPINYTVIWRKILHKSFVF